MLVTLGGGSGSAAIFYNTVNISGNIYLLKRSNAFPLFPPLDIFVPSHFAFAALVSFQRDTASQILGDVALPARLFNGTVDGFDLIPSLFRNNIWQICCRELLLGCDFRKIRRGGERRRRLRCRIMRQCRWMRERDVYAMDPYGPIEI